MLTIVILFFSLILFSACSQSIDEASMEQKSRVTVDFNTFQVEVEDMGRSSRTAPTLSDVAKRLSFVMFKSDGVTLVEETTIHQENTSNGTGFGSVELELYPGTYQMVAVAHNGLGNASIASTSSATLPGETITDTFTKVQELTVEPNKECSFTMPLNRITSAFILRLNDTPPANVKEIEVIVNTGGVDPASLDINPGTGRASNNWIQRCTIPVADLGNDVPIYFIGMIKETSVTITATAYDASENVIISHTLNNVSLVANKKTVATGTFFQSSVSGAFTVTTWDADQNINY